MKEIEDIVRQQLALRLSQGYRLGKLTFSRHRGDDKTCCILGSFEPIDPMAQGYYSFIMEALKLEDTPENYQNIQKLEGGWMDVEEGYDLNDPWWKLGAKMREEFDPKDR